MTSAAKGIRDERHLSHRHSDHAARSVVAFAGALFSLVGAVLAIGGYLALSGSTFHMLLGTALMVSGVLVAKRHRAGAWTYVLAFAGTVAWSLRNIEGGSPLAIRLAGPVLLLAVLALLLPVLCHWRPRNAVIAFIGLSLATVAVGAAARGPLAPSSLAVTQFLDPKPTGVLQ